MKPSHVVFAAVALLTGCTNVSQSRVAQPMVAITIDDLPLHGPLPRGETPLSVARNVIEALKAQNVEAYGFVNGYWTQRDSSTSEVLNSWRAAGLPLGNHGWSHRHLNEMTAAEFEQELLRNEPLLATGGEDWRWFRYPFLDEGESSEKRTASRNILARHGYKIAAVTMDFSDWMWTAPYERCRNADDQVAVARLEKLYLQAALESIGYYRRLSKVVYGRDIPYVLLLHVSAFEGRMLPRLLQLYRDEGFRFVSLRDAESDAAYADQAQPQLPAERQGLENKASAKMTLPQRTDFASILESMCKG
jgi:peptidoglycan/xylan/chitin deacetylase (PgdA/CDA1 family)